MGGYGSTRWAWHDKKNTVEDSKVLSVFNMKRDGILKPDSNSQGSWTWRNSFTNEQTASIGYKFNSQGSISYLRLFYTTTRWDSVKQDFDYQIRMQTTPCQFGGMRWWFTCPLIINDCACQKRVAKLYLPPNGRYFGCRHCYDLTYQSSQESDKQVNALRKLGPYAILQGINSGNIDLIQGIKALPDEIWRR